MTYTYRDTIASLKAQYVGKTIVYAGDNGVYKIVDVDYNGGLLINKPARFTDTTAVPFSAVQVVG